MNLYQPTITGSLSVSGSVNISGSITIEGGGTISGTASIATTALTASSADNLLVRNTLTAQTLVVQTITSSVDFVTGSTRFGSSLSNTHVFSGSVTMNPGGLFVSSSGNVGIGNIIPAYTLDVSGTGRFTGALRVDHSTAGAYGAVIYNTSATGQGLTVRGGSTSSQDAFNVQTYDGNRSLLSVQGGGNVGIGTSSPASLLSIAGSSSTQLKGLILRNGDGTTNSSVTLDFEASAGTIGDTASLAGRIEGIRTGAGTSGALAFSTTNSGTLTERMRITSGGQVGIGTTSWSQPYTKLIVAGAIAYNNNGDDAVSDNSYGQSFAKKIDIVGNSGANTIYSAAGSEGAFYVISGLNQTTGARFVDLLLYLGAASTTPVVVSSQTYLSPGGRTYGNSGENLTLSVTGNSNTYTIRMTGMGANERS